MLPFRSAKTLKEEMFKSNQILIVSLPIYNELLDFRIIISNSKIQQITRISVNLERHSFSILWDVLMPRAPQIWIAFIKRHGFEIAGHWVRGKRRLGTLISWGWLPYYLYNFIRKQTFIKKFYGHSLRYALCRSFQIFLKTHFQ